jgi:cation-transporting ATPase F
VDSVAPSVGNSHHTLPAHEVVLLLETDPHRGLTEGQARERLNRFGPNALPAQRGPGLLVRILRQFSCRCQEFEWRCPATGPG